MAIPIQLAITWPERKPCVGQGLDLTQLGRLNFFKPDFEKFPALRLAFEVARRGGTSGAALNAANEQAVDVFMKGKIKFGEIVEVIERVVSDHPWVDRPTLEQLLQTDQWARNEVNKWVQK